MQVQNRETLTHYDLHTVYEHTPHSCLLVTHTTTGKYSLHAVYHLLRENKLTLLLAASLFGDGRLVPDLGVGQDSVGMRLTDQHAACLLFFCACCSQTHPHSQAFQLHACLPAR